MISERSFNCLMERYRQQAAIGDVEESLAQQLEPFRVHNAVIMAAGMSSRFAPLSYEKPKALLEVKGEILIEREIRQLQAAGIKEIYLVVGYMKEKLFYLADKFGIQIIVNEDYYRYNNTSTLMCVKDRLSNTYICSSDNYFPENPFERFVYRPYYAAVYAEGDTDEYCLSCESDGRISEVTIGGCAAWYMMGHAYFDRVFSARFIEIMTEEYKKPAMRECLWEDLYCRHLDELVLYIRRYKANMIHEFDTLDDLREFDERYIKNVDSRVFDNICKVLGCEEKEIRGIIPVKYGMTNLSFRFICRGIWYIYRHPGVGTETYINRHSEAASMAVAQKLGLDDTFMHINAEEGWKLSYYIQDAEQLDYRNWEQVEKALQALQVLHRSEAETAYKFDIWKIINNFQQHLADIGRDDFKDMHFLRSKMEALYRSMIKDGRRCLCHADSFNTNFLFDTSGKVYLIDWEYSGMADPAVDIGIFVTCADYTWTEVLNVLKIYLGHEPMGMELFHYISYIAICSYYCFLWALYQESNGKSVDQYMYIWYQNTKVYEQKAEEIYQSEMK